MFVLINKITRNPIMYHYDGKEYPVGHANRAMLQSYIDGDLAIPSAFYDDLLGGPAVPGYLDILDKEAEAEAHVKAVESDILSEIRNRVSEVVDLVSSTIAPASASKFQSLLDMIGLAGPAEPATAPEAETPAAPLPTRVTQDRIDKVIVGETYFVHGTLTICVLELENGFTVTGEAACVDPASYDVEMGRKLARSRARERIWPLEGYLLRQRHHDTGL